MIFETIFFPIKKLGRTLFIVFAWALTITMALLVLLLYILYYSNQEKRLASQLLDQNVRERTQAVELSYAKIKQTLDTRDAIQTKVTRTVRSHMATLSGLCAVGLKEVDGLEIRQYLQKIALVVRQVSSNLQSVLNEDNNNVPEDAK